MVAARELDQTNLPAVGWVNERLQYTHGFGVVFSPANNVASQGQPDFYVKGVPATTTVAELEVEQPRIYFCLLYTSPSPRDATLSRMPSSA